MRLVMKSASAVLCFASFSFSDVPVNILTGSGYDPITDTAELKVCPVRVDPL